MSVAASAIGADPGVLDSGPKQRALIEIVFEDGATFVAMADVGIAALMENDRRVIRLAAGRLRIAPRVEGGGEPASGLGERVIAWASGAADAAGSAVSSAFSFVKSKTLG